MTTHAGCTGLDWLEALFSGHVDDLAALTHPDFRHELVSAPPLGGIRTARGLRSVMRTLRQHWLESGAFTVEFEVLASDGTRAVVEGWGDVPGRSETRYANRYLWVMEVTPDNRVRYVAEWLRDHKVGGIPGLAEIEAEPAQTIRDGQDSREAALRAGSTAHRIVRGQLP